MVNKKKLALTIIGIMSFNTILNSISFAGDVNETPDPAIVKAKDLGILKVVTDKAPTLADTIIGSLRTKMLLDYRVGLAMVTNPITGNAMIDSYLNTATLLYNINITKENVYQPLSKDKVVEIVTKIENVDVSNQLQGNVTKKDLAKVLVYAYDTVVSNNFAKLEGNDNGGTTGSGDTNSGTTGNDDILGGALDDLLSGGDDNQTNNDNSETGNNDTTNNVSATVEVVSPWKINVKTEANVSKVVLVDSNGNEIENNFSKDTNGYTINVKGKLTEGTITIKLMDSSDNTIFTKDETLSFNKDVYVKTLNNNAVIGFNNIAEIDVLKDTNITINISGLFDFDKVGDVFITDESLKKIYSKKIRQGEDITRNLTKGTYYIVIENKTAGSSTLKLKINDEVIPVKLYDLNMGNVDMPFSAETGADKTISSDETITLVWTAQNTGDEAVSLSKFTLKSNGSADVSDIPNNVKIGEYSNQSCNINDSYKTLESGNNIIFISTDNERAIKLDVTDTKKICVSITGIYGDEGDSISFKTENDDLSTLFSVSKYPGIYGQVNVGAVSSGYGNYTIKSASVLFSQSSESNVKIPVGDNVPVYKWNTEVLGQNVRTDSFTILIQDITGNISAGSIDNAKLVYSANGTEKIIDIDTSPVISGNTATLNFKNTVDIPKGKGLFVLRADLANSLDGHKLKVNINKANVKFENKDTDTINPVTSVVSPDLLVLKADIDITNSVRTVNGLVNTKEIVGQFTISNLGGTDVILSKVDLAQNSTAPFVTGKFSLAGIGLAEGNTDNIDVDNVTLISDYENVLGNTAHSFSINKTTTIPAGETKTFVVIGKIDGTGLVGNEQMQWTIPANGITLVTNYGSSLSNSTALPLDIIITKLHGKANISLHNDVDDSKIKSPSDKYVSLGRISIEAKYEKLRLNKLTLKGTYNGSNNGFIDLDKVYLVKSTNNDCKVDDFSTDKIAGVGIVGTTSSVVISLNEEIDAVTNGSNTATLTNYCVYGKLLNNENGFVKGNLYLTLGTASDIEIYGTKTGNLYDATSLTLGGTGRVVNFYPAVLTFNPGDNVTVTTAGDNKQLLAFNLQNKDDKNIKIKNMKFSITPNPQIVIRNFKLVDAVTDNTIASTSFYVTNGNNSYIEFNNINYVLNKYYSKDIKLVADVYTLGSGSTGIDGQVQLTVNIGNPDDVTTRNDTSIEYVAVEDNGTEIPFSGSITDVWFSNSDDSTVSNYSWTTTAVDFQSVSLDASCNALIDNSGTSASFTYDNTNNVYTGSITLGFTSNATTDQKNTILNALTLDTTGLTHTTISNISKDATNYKVTFDYTLDTNGASLVSNDIPLLAGEKIKLNTIYNDCYVATNTASVPASTYEVSRTNASENIEVETDPTKNNLAVTFTNNNASGTANVIEAGDTLSVNVHDIDNQNNALYNILSDITNSSATVALDTPANLGIDSADTVKDVIVLNGNIAIRFNTGTDLSITDGGDGNNPTATVNFNSTTNYTMNITLINSADDDTIGTLDASTSTVNVYVNDGTNWIDLGQVSYNSDY